VNKLLNSYYHRIDGKISLEIWRDESASLAKHLRKVRSLVQDMSPATSAGLIQMNSPLDQDSSPQVQHQNDLGTMQTHYYFIPLILSSFGNFPVVHDKEKRGRLRTKALEELIFSEKTYLLNLLTVTHMFIEPLKRGERKLVRSFAVTAELLCIDAGFFLRISYTILYSPN